MRYALAVISVAVLAIHGVVFYNQYYATWQDHQAKYFREAAAKADSPAVKATLASRAPQVEQTIVRSFGTERVEQVEA